MSTYSTNEFKGGLKLLIDGQPCSIIQCEFVKPGKGQAFARVKLRNLMSQSVLEKTYKSGEKVDGADVQEQTMTFLYNDGSSWHFMDETTYEQLSIDASAMGPAAQWVKEQDACTVTLWNGQAISVEPPNFVELVVKECDPGLKGDTVSGGTKPATMETGAVVKVPLFVNVGDTLKIDTRTGDYVSRA